MWNATRDAGTWAGSEPLLACCFHSTPSDIREVRVRADSGFGYRPVLEMLEARPAQYAVVPRMIPSLKRVLKGLRYEAMNPPWETWNLSPIPTIGLKHGVALWRAGGSRRTIRSRLCLPWNRYAYRAWHTNLPPTPTEVWHFYDGRAGMEPRIRERREDFALRKIPTRASAANALFLEVVLLA